MACTKASGEEQINLTSQVVEHIAKQFNNPDISDVTLMVGEQVYSAHRFVLASQSSVFYAMLLGENWKESAEKTVPLEEPANVVTFFPDFLKFFYTGKLTLTLDNVCIIHTLADKYMVSALKDSCLDFMKDVLTGVHGDALQAGVKWLEYIENFAPDLVFACDSAIRNHMFGVTNKPGLKGKLNKEQIIRIFTVDNVEDEIVTATEASLFKIIRHLYSGNEIDSDFIPLIRFYYMSPEHLEMYCQESKLLLEAYRVKAELADIVSRANKKRRLSDGSANDEIRCRCPINTKCPHINPRFYLETPFSGLFDGYQGLPCKVDAIDLRDVKSFAMKMMSVEEHRYSSYDRQWSVYMKGCYSGEPIYESFEVRPAYSHRGRMFTVVIIMIASGSNSQHAKYTIKYTGRIEMDDCVKSLVLKSPLRVKGSWKLKSVGTMILGVSVLLHV